MLKRLKNTLSGCYCMWRLYHLFFTDVSSITNIIRRYLWKHELNSSSGSCLDIGSGGGSYLKYLRTCFKTVISLDMSIDSHLRLSRRFKRHSGVHFICCDGSSLPFKTSTFGCVIAMEVLEHIWDDSSTLSEIARCMKENSKLVLSVPNSDCSDSGQIDDDKYGHKRVGYNKEQLTGMIEAAGLTIKKTEFFFHYFSRLTFGFIITFKKLFGFYPPFPVLIPVWLERIFIKYFRKYSQGANILIIATKS